ncbi:MAG: YggS family pyridoxal phosphate-dependent enzyme [Polyangiaceae bacterium]|nr:YggS family pyridoxal phosphate-dependent enzyme [Polyangiaceae bacterium]
MCTHFYPPVLPRPRLTGYCAPVDEGQLTIALRIAKVRTQIAAACERTLRPISSVQLLAVSKTKSEAAIREAYAAGQRDFGENYVQEMVAKAAALADLPDLRLHLIGPLQRNKVKQVLPIAALIHTVDRETLADEIQKRAEALGRVVPVLIEVNVGGELSKAGCTPDDAERLADHVRACKNLSLRGLMTIPPDTDDRDRTRGYFAALRDLRDKIGNLPDLSMGMSHDFEIAIEEGATIVRVGTAIFGSRS